MSSSESPSASDATFPSEPVSGECNSEPDFPLEVDGDSEGRAGKGGGTALEPDPEASADADADASGCGGPVTVLSIEAGIGLALAETEDGNDSGGRPMRTARDFSLRAGESVRALPLALRMKVYAKDGSVVFTYV